MKKIFQWKDLNWKNMTPQEKLNFKRLCLIPVAAYVILIFLKTYASSIVLLIILYFAYRWFQKNN